MFVDAFFPLWVYKLFLFSVDTKLFLLVEEEAINLDLQLFPCIDKE